MAATLIPEEANAFLVLSILFEETEQ